MGLISNRLSGHFGLVHFPRFTKNPQWGLRSRYRASHAVYSLEQRFFQSLTRPLTGFGLSSCRCANCHRDCSAAWNLEGVFGLFNALSALVRDDPCVTAIAVRPHLWGLPSGVCADQRSHASKTQTRYWRSLCARWTPPLHSVRNRPVRGHPSNSESPAKAAKAHVLSTTTDVSPGSPLCCLHLSCGSSFALSLGGLYPSEFHYG